MTADFSMKKYRLDALHDRGIDEQRREIWLTSEPDLHDDDWSELGVEHSMTTKFIKNIRLLGKPKSKPILIHLKSMGGEYQEGMAIFDSLMACPCDTTILSYTHARSMSSIILQAADNRVLMPNSYVLIHRGSIFLGGEVKAVMSNIDYEKKICLPTMFSIYAHRMTTTKGSRFFGEPMNKAVSELRKRMNEHGDVFFTPGAAIEFGLADSVFTSWEDLKPRVKLKKSKKPKTKAQN